MNTFYEENLAGNSKEAIDILGRKWKYDCMSCAIAKGELELPGGLIFEDKYITIGADVEIPLNGFIIIATKRHINSISELTDDERYDLIDYIAEVIKALKDLNIIEKVTIVQEERANHLHVWIFPCHKEYEEKMGKGVGSIKDICKHIKDNVTDEEIQKCLETVTKLKEYFMEVKDGRNK